MSELFTIFTERFLSKHLLFSNICVTHTHTHTHTHNYHHITPPAHIYVVVETQLIASLRLVKIKFAKIAFFRYICQTFPKFKTLEKLRKSCVAKKMQGIPASAGMTENVHLHFVGRCPTLMIYGLSARRIRLKALHQQRGATPYETKNGATPPYSVIAGLTRNPLKNGNGFLTLFGMTAWGYLQGIPASAGMTVAPPQPSPKGRKDSPSFGGGWGEVSFGGAGEVLLDCHAVRTSRLAMTEKPPLIPPKGGNRLRLNTLQICRNLNRVFSSPLGRLGGA